MTHIILNPGDNYWTASTVLIENGLVIEGPGANACTLIVPSGLDITYTLQQGAPTLKGFTIVKEGQGGTAIKITGNLSPVFQGPKLYDISIVGNNAASDYWDTGIHFVDVWNPILRDVNIKGKNQISPPFSMNVGVKFERTQVLSIDKLDVYHVQTAILQIGSTYGEGFSLCNFNFVGVNIGISILQGGGYVIKNGHINSFLYGILCTGKVQLIIDSVNMYKTHYSTSNYIGLWFTNCYDMKVTNCIVDGGWAAAYLNSGTTYGFVLGLVTHSYFSGNTFSNFRVPSVGIVVGSMSNYNIITDNRSIASGTAVVVNPDAGPNNKLSNNWSF